MQYRFLPLVLVLLAFAQSAFSTPKIERPVFRDGPDVELRDEVMVRTAETDFAGGPCALLLGKPRQKPVISRERLQNILGSVGRIIPTAESNNPAINCHSFACMQSGIVFPPDAWLDAHAGYAALLKEYFVSLKMPFDHESMKGFLTESTLRDGDLVLMFGPGGLHHSGIVKKENGHNWILSKLDEDMTVLTSLENLWNPYVITRVTTFRRK